MENSINIIESFLGEKLTMKSAVKFSHESVQRILKLFEKLLEYYLNYSTSFIISSEINQSDFHFLIDPAQTFNFSPEYNALKKTMLLYYDKISLIDPMSTLVWFVAVKGKVKSLNGGFSNIIKEHGNYSFAKIYDKNSFRKLTKEIFIFLAMIKPFVENNDIHLIPANFIKDRIQSGGLIVDKKFYDKNLDYKRKSKLQNDNYIVEESIYYFKESLRNSKVIHFLQEKKISNDFFEKMIEQSADKNSSIDVFFNDMSFNSQIVSFLNLVPVAGTKFLLNLLLQEVKNLNIGFGTRSAPFVEFITECDKLPTARPEISFEKIFDLRRHSEAFNNFRNTFSEVIEKTIKTSNKYGTDFNKEFSIIKNEVIKPRYDKLLTEVKKSRTMTEIVEPGVTTLGAGGAGIYFSEFSRLGEAKSTIASSVTCLLILGFFRLYDKIKDKYQGEEKGKKLLLQYYGYLIQ